jgi:hypothetical protein
MALDPSGSGARIFAKQLNQQSFKLRTVQIGKWG